MWGRRSLECYITHPKYLSIYCTVIDLFPSLSVDFCFRQDFWSTNHFTNSTPQPSRIQISDICIKNQPTAMRLPSHIVRNKKNPVKRPELINCRIWALNPELFVAANSCTAEGITGVFLRQWRAVEWLYCIFPQQRNRMSPHPNFINTVSGQLSF